MRYFRAEFHWLAICLAWIAAEAPAFAQNSSLASKSKPGASVSDTKLKDQKKKLKSQKPQRTRSASVNPALLNSEGFFSNLLMEGRRSFGENGRTSGTFDGSLGYTFEKNWYASTTFEMNHLVTKYEDADNHFAFGDTEIDVGSNNIAESSDHSLKAYFNGLFIAPTSKTSQKTSLRGTYGLNVGLLERFGPFIASLSNQFSVSDYRYETADIGGTQYNEIYSSWTKLNLTYRFLPDWAFENRNSIYVYRNFAGNTRSVYRVSGGISYTINSTWSAVGRVQFKDRVVTNNSFFNDDNVTASLAVMISI